MDTLELGSVRPAHRNRHDTVAAAVDYQQRAKRVAAQRREPETVRNARPDLFVVVGAVGAERPAPADQIGDRRLCHRRFDHAVAGEQGGERPPGRGPVGVDAAGIEGVEALRFRPRGRDGSAQVAERVVQVVRDESGGDRTGPGQRFEERVLVEERAAVDEDQVRGQRGALADVRRGGRPAPARAGRGRGRPAAWPPPGRRRGGLSRAGGYVHNPARRTPMLSSWPSIVAVAAPAVSPS